MRGSVVQTTKRTDPDLSAKCAPYVKSASETTGAKSNYGAFTNDSICSQTRFPRRNLAWEVTGSSFELAALTLRLIGKAAGT